MKALKYTVKGYLLEPVDIIVPVADKNDEIAARCLGHIQKTQGNYNIILVEERGSSFRFGKSVNRGIAQAKSDIVIQLDTDCFPQPGAIEKMVEYMRHYPDVGYAGTRREDRYLPGWKYIGWTWRNILLSAPITLFIGKAPFFLIKKIKRYGLFSKDLCSVDYYRKDIIGQGTGFCGIRKDAWEDVGGFSEMYVLSYADLDFCAKIIRSKKWKVTSFRSIEYSHEGQKSRRKYRSVTTFDDRDMFEEEWSPAEIRKVIEDAKAGKFLIPKKGIGS